MEPLNCIILDDNEIDRLLVLSFVKKFPALNIVGTFASAEEILPAINAGQIDILFLDIDLPGINGIEFRKKMLQVPACVFISSHAEYAIESFEVEALDFILKPLQIKRFTQTVARLQEFFSIKQMAALYESSFNSNSITIKEGHEQTTINLGDILYLEGLKDYTLIVTDKKRHCVLLSIGNFLKQYELSNFVRIHRSYAVQKKHVKKITPYDVELINNTLLPIGRSYKNSLNPLLG